MNALKETAKGYRKQIEQIDTSIAGLKKQITNLEAKKTDVAASLKEIEKIVGPEPEKPATKSARPTGQAAS
jgi:prefoldin subunit 5